MADPGNRTETLAITDAALRLGVSREAAIRMVQRGLLEGGQELGRWWYVTRESVDRYLADQQAAAAS